jgi:hypothetical protein
MFVPGFGIVVGINVDNFISSEDARIEAKIESREISIEDIAAV